MELTAGEHTLGPDNGVVRIRTGREGVAARVGHDLVIGFGRWSGALRVGPGGPGDVSVEVAVEVASFTVLSGTGGVSELSEGDRADITKSALKVLEADRHPTIQFRSTAVRPESGSLDGELTVAGRTALLTLRVVESAPGSYRAEGRIKQTDLGLKPYKAMLGALRLADVVEIEAEIDLSGK
jgi:polyisoprenoid-binding protein YceI